MTVALSSSNFKIGLISEIEPSIYLVAPKIDTLFAANELQATHRIHSAGILVSIGARSENPYSETMSGNASSYIKHSIGKFYKYIIRGYANIALSRLSKFAILADLETNRKKFANLRNE